MSADDLTKNLPDEDAPTADPLPPPDTAPMLEKILKEVISTRDLLTARIEAVEQKVDRIETKLDLLNKRILDNEADVASLTRRVETLDDKRV